MLSRAADNLYWLGRYLQRAENTARLINAHANLLLDMPKSLETGWSPLVEIFSADALFREHYDTPSEANVVRFLVMDARNPSSIVSSIHAAREILRATRDYMQREIWEKVNNLHLIVSEGSERSMTRARRQELLARVVDSALMVYGMFYCNLSHDTGFQFLRLGTNLEQADMTTRVIDVRSSNLIKPKSAEDLRPFQSIQWMGVLRMLTAYQMYRRDVRQRVSGPLVLRYLLQNREFPRSAMFCINQIASTLPHLPPSRKIERTVQRTQALLLDANIEKLVEAGLHEFIDEIQISLGGLHTAISETYFRA